MMKLKMLTIAFLWAFALCLGFASFASADNGSIIYSPAADAKTLNPLKAGGSYSLYSIQST